MRLLQIPPTWQLSMIAGRQCNIESKCRRCKSDGCSNKFGGRRQRHLAELRKNTRLVRLRLFGPIISKRSVGLKTWRLRRLSPLRRSIPRSIGILEWIQPLLRLGSLITRSRTGHRHRGTSTTPTDSIASRAICAKQKPNEPFDSTASNAYPRTADQSSLSPGDTRRPHVRSNSIDHGGSGGVKKPPFLAQITNSEMLWNHRLRNQSQLKRPALSLGLNSRSRSNLPRDINHPSRIRFHTGLNGFCNDEGETPANSQSNRHVGIWLDASSGRKQEDWQLLRREQRKTGDCMEQILRKLSYLEQRLSEFTPVVA